MIVEGIVMIAGMLLVFFAYREGIKTGLSMQNGKVPAITPKEKEVEKNEFEKAVEAQQLSINEAESMVADVEEALNFNNLYKGGDQ